MSAEHDTPIVVRRSRSRRRQLAIVGVAVLILGAAFAAGAVVGWREALQTDPGRLPDTVTIAVGSTRADGGAAVVPDVRGMTREAAEQAMADAGVPVVALDVAEVPSALPSGTVLRQDPPGGSPFSGTVTLDAATAGVVPQVTGRPLTQVRAELEHVGAEVVVEYDLADGAAAGTVLSSEPATGLPLPARVLLRAAAAPASVYLSELRTVSGGGSTGAVALNGADFDQALQISGTAEYLLDRGVQRLTAVVGIPDRSRADSSATVIVSADGRELRRLTLAYGRTENLEVPLTGALRLTIDVEGDTAALGDPLLVGRPEAIDALDRR